MRDYEPAMSFGPESARLHDARGDEAEAVAFLADAASGGPVLELAIGTGRLALPLAERGLQIDGIDIAPAMIERLREKPGGSDLHVVHGDFTDVGVDGSYALVFVAWNSFFNLLSQDAQVRCFENVAAHLESGGRFVIEAFTPAFLHRLKDGQEVAAEDIQVGSVRVGVMKHDPAEQRLEQTHVTLSERGVRLDPVVQRYAWPAELDLMARIAGLRLVERWADWKRTPFSNASDAHVSVYGR